MRVAWLRTGADRCTGRNQAQPRGGRDVSDELSEPGETAVTEEEPSEQKSDESDQRG